MLQLEHYFYFAVFSTTAFATHLHTQHYLLHCLNSLVCRKDSLPFRFLDCKFVNCTYKTNLKLNALFKLLVDKSISSRN